MKFIKRIIPYFFFYNPFFQNFSCIKAINLQITDMCNSRCCMCNIWKKHGHNIISPLQLKEIFKDKAFYNVEHIGFSGGEPSIVKSLEKYYYTAIKHLPNLKSISIISNSINPHDTIFISEELKNITQEYNINYSVMISLDGIGSIHDKNRGVKGNFESCLYAINHFKLNNINFCTGTTITSNNVWNLDHLLIFLTNNNIHGYFRIADFINRLDNYNCKNIVRNFTYEEKHQIKLFFYKLIYKYEKSEIIKNTYYNIINMIGDKTRITKCPYADGNAINIDSYGAVSCCAPKDNIFFKFPSKHFYKYFIEHFNTKFNEIKKEFCSHCIHDYHGEFISGTKTDDDYKKKLSYIFSVKYFFSKKILSVYTPPINENYIFIIGWYGTETVGDKAILKSTIEYYSKKYPNLNIKISSLYPFITQKTINELNIKADIIHVYSLQFFQVAFNADIVVVGGGPLMELEELSLILWAFYYSKKNNKQRHIYGCGIGPLYSDEKKLAVKTILKYAQKVKFRDLNSYNYAKNNLNLDINAEIIPDPAILTFKKNKINIPKKNILACFFRKLTFEYRGDMDFDIFISFKNKFEEQLAKNIILLCEYFDLKPYLYSMHNFVIGNDDRDFNFYFADKFLKTIDCYIEDRLSTIETISTAMQQSHLNLCMRFHSVLFAHSLKTNFVAIDYTIGGKIHSFMHENNIYNQMISMANIINSEYSLLNMVKSE